MSPDRTATLREDMVEELDDKREREQGPRPAFVHGIDRQPVLLGHLSAAFVALVLLAGFGASHDSPVASAASTLAAAARPTAAPLPASYRMTLWMVRYGEPFEKIISDTFQRHITTTRPPPFVSACRVLQKAISSIQTKPRVPIGSVRTHWQKAIGALGNGVRACLNGARSKSVSTIDEFWDDLAHGERDLTASNAAWANLTNGPPSTTTTPPTSSVPSTVVANCIATVDSTLAPIENEVVPAEQEAIQTTESTEAKYAPLSPEAQAEMGVAVQQMGENISDWATFDSFCGLSVAPRAFLRVS
jgi:hypothetical protein